MSHVLAEDELCLTVPIKKEVITLVSTSSGTSLAMTSSMISFLSVKYSALLGYLKFVRGSVVTE